MKTFKSYLTEKYVNLHDKDHEEKMKHADHVYSMLSKAYESQGGLKGKEFGSAHDIVKHIPHWKLHKHEGKVKAVAMYKEKGGRKRVAIATDGSEEGKKGLTDIIKNDVSQHRSYSEISGRSLSHHVKHMDVQAVAHKHEDAKKILHATGEMDVRKPPHDDPEVQKHPHLKDHFYQRKIGGEWHTKVMIGTPGVKTYKK